MQRSAVRLILWVGIGSCVSTGPALARRASLLPTQQRIRAIGKEVDLGLFPTGAALSADGRLMLVTNNGFLYQSVTAVDTETLQVKDLRMGAVARNVLFIGVALSPDGYTGYASGHTEGSYNDVIYPVTIGPGPTLARSAAIVLPRGSFPAGLAMSRDGSRLYIAENLADKLGVVDTQAKTLIAEIPVGRQPWNVALHPTLPQAYVTNRVDRTVSVVDTETMSVIATVPTGSGPNAVAVSPNGAKIFVADAHSDDLTVFDVNAPESVRRISLLPFEGALPGSSPNALAFAPDGSRLYVANGWDNAIIVVSPQSEQIIGGIPTGWYPTAIAVSPDNRRLYVSNMKGSRTFPRTRHRQPLDTMVNLVFGGTYGVKGTLSVLPVPSDRQLRLLGQRVRQNNGFDTGRRPGYRGAAAAPCFPIPCQPGDPTPIKHVVFIVRENKTYDQDLGDLPQGDGEPSLVLYGRDITPNLHKLVEEFVLMDHFYADSEKSEPGHQWTTASIDTDYVEKTWPAASSDGRPDDIGVHADENYVMPVAAPEGGYWFDNCHDHGVSFRIYGEFLRADDDGEPFDYWVANHSPDYPIFNLDIPDQHRFDVWKAEFDQQVQNGTVPQFTYMTLPNDHTKGTGTGIPDPRSFVADNDLATGKVVEAISNSSVWPETAIFILEDDPQSGADHIDSHRTIGAVISPYVRRHYVTHTRFDMASMHRTMELILGLPPMSQFDQMAVPMRELFTDTPDLTSYTAVPASFPFTLTRASRGAALSAQQDWSTPDRVPDALLNQLLWDYLKGPDSQR
jgi:YVTN family beta-propeller protein